MTAGRAELLGVGLDVVDLARFARSAVRPGFLEHICTPRELDELPQAGEERTRRAACLFAYKEAVLKALGTGAWQQGTGFHDVEVLLGTDLAGPAAVTLRDGAARAQLRGGGGRLELAHEVEATRVKAYCLWLK